MKKLKDIYILFFFMVNFVLPIYGQFLPKDESKLNYNQIYFEYPYNEHAAYYTLYLAIDSTQNKTDFKTSLYNTYIDKTPATRVNGLEFGQHYKWYIETHLKSGEKTHSDIHYFSLLRTNYTDTSKYKVKQNYYSKNKVEDGLIWCDHLHCALNRKGEVVWFIPPINPDFKEERQIRDFRFQKDGTITFISEPEAYYTDRDLNIIWKGPNDGKVSHAKNEFYHHCFEKLANGNYMTLGNDYVELERVDTKDTASRKVELATLIEYNIKGDIVWSWKMIDHFPLDLLASEDGKTVLNPHCNSFSIDQQHNYIYLGFRDISRVIKIEKSSGNIVTSYGKKLNKLDTNIVETPAFRNPHDATILEGNKLLIINNNEVNKDKISSLELLQLPISKEKKCESILSFKFDFDTLTNGKSVKLGGAKIFKNGNFLINEGAINRLVEITKTKKVLWDLMIYKKENGKHWSNHPQYNIDFSSSLYPYYFSLSSLKKTGQKLTFIVFNEGDYKDSYKIELYDEFKKNKIITQQTFIINPQKNQSIQLEIKKQMNFKLIITSINSNLIREFSVAN